MYDPIETNISFKYMLKLKEKAKSLRFRIIGGWGVFFHVKEDYQRAFGKEYLKSRDIDVFIDSRDEAAFLRIITDLGFKPSSYKFRYELIYNREAKRIVSPKEAKKKPVFNLAYIFLDVFSNKKTKKLGSWVFPGLNRAKVETIEEYPVLDVKSLLNLKIISFFERERLDKELKDACDIFALLFYSGKRIKPSLMIKKAAERIISRPDLQEYVAESVLGDSLKASLVVSMLRKWSMG